MPRVLFAVTLVIYALNVPAHAQEQMTKAPDHYQFVWTSDAAHKGNDFFAVIDADPSSASYGHLVTSLATDQQTMRVHHTEYSMPANGMLFGNNRRLRLRR
jgi:hypothetical protein